MSDRRRAVVFGSIYARNRWAGTESPAGPGSETASTRELAAWLPAVVKRHGIRSVLDAGCGASWWMPELPGYVGWDIVPAAVSGAQDRHVGRNFAVGDLVRDPLPDVDAVFVRDVLAHLSNDELAAALDNIRTSGVPWLFATYFATADNTEDTRTGGYREYDLRTTPYALGPPVEHIPDGWWGDRLVYVTKWMGLWRLGS